MIITKSFLKHWRINENTANAAECRRTLREFPLIWFGATCVYPKVSKIIRDWVEKRPMVTVITGWKRVGKSAIGSFLGSCFLFGELNHRWPGCKTMGVQHPVKWDKKVSGQRVGLIGGRSMDHLEAVLLPMYRELLPPSYIKTWFAMSATNKKIQLDDGSRCVVRSYDQSLEVWKSGSYQFMHLDEEPPLEILNECLERRRLANGKIIISVAIDDADVSYLPDACMNPKKYFGTESFYHAKLGVEDVPDNIYPALEKKIVFTQYDGTPLEKAVRFGEFSYLSGKWWADFDPSIHVIKAFKIPKDWKRYRSVDAGYAAPTACLWAAVHPMGFLIVYREFYKTGKTVEERCKEIIEASGNERYRSEGIWKERQTSEQYEMTLLDYHEFKTDAVTGDGLDFEYIRAGLEVCPSTTFRQEARRDVMHRWLFVNKQEKHFITHKPGAPRIYFMDTCVNTIWEAQKKCFKRAKTERQGVQETKIQNRDDHGLDCAENLACELAWMVEGRGNL